MIIFGYQLVICLELVDFFLEFL